MDKEEINLSALQENLRKEGLTLDGIAPVQFKGLTPRKDPNKETVKLGTDDSTVVMKSYKP